MKSSAHLVYPVIVACILLSSQAIHAEQAPFQYFGKFAYRSQINDEFSGVIVDRFDGNLFINRIKNHGVRIRIEKPTSTIEAKFYSNHRYIEEERSGAKVIHRLKGRWTGNGKVRATSMRRGKLIREDFSTTNFIILAMLRINPGITEFYDLRPK